MVSVSRAYNAVQAIAQCLPGPRNVDISKLPELLKCTWEDARLTLARKSSRACVLSLVALVLRNTRVVLLDLLLVLDVVCATFTLAVVGSTMTNDIDVRNVNDTVDYTTDYEQYTICAIRTETALPFQ